MKTFYVRQRNKTTLVCGISLKKLFNELIQSEGKLIHPTQPLELIPGKKVTIMKTDGSFVCYELPEDLQGKESILPGVAAVAAVASIWVVTLGVDLGGGHFGGWIMKWLIALLG